MSPREGGQLQVLQLPRGATQLSASDAAGGQFELRLEPATAAPTAVANALRREGRLDDAQRAAQTLLHSTDVATRADAFGLTARLALQRGEVAIARDMLDRALALQVRAGCSSCAGRDALMAAYIDTVPTLAPDRARASLRYAEQFARDDPELGALVPYYRGLLERKQGDLRSAIDAFEASRTLAARLDMRDDARTARQLLAIVYQGLGQYAEALRRLEALRDEMPADVSACERADLYNDLGWVALLGAASRTRSSQLTAAETAAIASPLKQALELYLGQCQEPLAAANAHGNLALLTLSSGNLTLARSHFQQAQILQPEPEQRVALWMQDIDAQLVLASGAAAHALRAFDDLLRGAVQVQSRELQWRATIGRARALRALDDTAGALVAYRSAEDLIELEAQLAPFHEGREAFFSGRVEAQDEYLELLVSNGQATQAFEAARRMGRRVLVSLARIGSIAQLSPTRRKDWEDAVNSYRAGRAALTVNAAKDWSLAGTRLETELSERDMQRVRLERDFEHALARFGEPLAGDLDLERGSADELVVLAHSTNDALLLFTARGSSVRVSRLEAARGDLRGQVAVEIERMLAAQPAPRRVRLLGVASGGLEDTDWNALPIAGVPLVESLPVVYSLDLGARANAEQRPPARVLIVADPRSDLPEARREAGAIRALLRDALGSEVQLLVGARATAPAVTELLADVDTFHFAGHGAFATRTWYSNLRLAEDSELSVGDVLSLRRVPRLVFLGSCESARTGSPNAAHGLSVASAFLAAGASAVIAPVRVVDDASSRELAEAFYRDLPRRAGDAAEALRSAQLQLRARHPSQDWSAFRVFAR